MAEVTPSPGSWLNLTSLLEFKGIIFWDQFDFPDIPFSNDDQYIQLTGLQAQRIDLVASDAYGDAELLWALLLANNCDLPNQFIEGQTIRIPAKETIDQLLNSAQANY
jgi:hypothetical protein